VDAERDQAERDEVLPDLFWSVARRLRGASRDALESRGLVRRLPDPGDRRATLAELTEQGASVLDAIRAARGSEAERVFGRLTEADRANLARILAKLRE
jgi:DNA-binding MarR family transcriptional regulator